jgi:hypothetical protein
VGSISREDIMSDFTYTVFLIVASVCGLLVTVFAVGLIGVLFYGMRRTSAPAEPTELHRAA